jgi:hypothetical protein
VTVLERSADGLGVSRELMGLSYDDSSAYRGAEVTVTEPPEGVSAEMLRRHLIALGGVAAFGAPVARLGELLQHLELPDPSPVPPSQLSHVHVEKVRNLTRRLDEADNASGPDPEMSTAATVWASSLLGVPAEPVKQALMVAVAQLHCQAEWPVSTAVSTTGPCSTTPVGWSWPPRPATPTARSPP